MQLQELLRQLSGLTSMAILTAAGLHLLLFIVLWWWQRQDVRIIAASLDEFTRDLRHRSILDPPASVERQVDAFIRDVRELLDQRNRQVERAACLQRLQILDERRRYLDSLSFETMSNAARSMIEAYPLAGVLGTILAIGAALQGNTDAADPTTAMTAVVSRFGEAIWSTFFGLSAAIVLMFVNSVTETRFAYLSHLRQQVSELVALAKRELALASRVELDGS
jgi:biopolymer transport protein ExbB/TolQ